MYLCGALFTQLQYLWRPEEDVGLCGAVFTDGCELPDLGAGNRSHSSARAA